MKKSITIIFILLASCSKSQFFYHLIKDGVTANVVSGIKNIQPISVDSVYEAFGFGAQTKVNQIVYFDRVGTTHLLGGDYYYRKYNIAANHFSSRVLFNTGVKDARDVHGIKMDNDSVVLFIGRSNNGTGGDWSIDIQILKCDSNLNFTTPVNFNWGTIPRLQRSWVFDVTNGDNPGEGYASLVQINVDTGTVGRRRISALKTTDYWNTYSEVGIIWENTTTHYSETTITNLGGGKLVALKRNDQAGSLTPTESTNSGVTWVQRASSNLNHWIGGEPEIPFVYPHDGIFDIVYECRDADMIHISKANTIAANFGNGTPVYNGPEIYSHHLGIGSNPSLGYPWMQKISTTRYIIVYSKEYNSKRANLQWTIHDDLATDPANTPLAPPTIASSFITTTSFRMDMQGYTDKNIENIRYFQQDMSTDVNFSTFVTAKYRTPSAFPASPIHDIITTGLWNTYNSLTTGTTYYIRIKACNNVGCSSYTTVSVTTL